MTASQPLMTSSGPDPKSGRVKNHRSQTEFTRFARGNLDQLDLTLLTRFQLNWSIRVWSIQLTNRSGTGRFNPIQLGRSIRFLLGQVWIQGLGRFSCFLNGFEAKFGPILALDREIRNVNRKPNKTPNNGINLAKNLRQSTRFLMQFQTAKNPRSYSELINLTVELTMNSYDQLP